MFEWEGLAGRVASGEAAPLDAVPALAGLDDEALLGLGQEQALAVIELAQAALAALAAVQAAAVEAFTRREQEGIDRFVEAERCGGRPTCWVKDADESVPVMLAPVFHLAPRTMHSMLFELRTLVNDLPTTFGLARAGRLEASRARTVAGHAGCVDRGYLGDFEEQLHAKDITTMAHAAVRARAAVTALRVDPASARHRGDDARRDREVRVRPGEPGMSEWSASQPAEVSVRAWAAIEALAVQYATANPALNIGQARADAMMDLILAQASIETTIDLVIPLPDLHDHDSDHHPHDRDQPPNGDRDRDGDDRDRASGRDQRPNDDRDRASGRDQRPNGDRDRDDPRRIVDPDPDPDPDPDAPGPAEPGSDATGTTERPGSSDPGHAFTRVDPSGASDPGHAFTRATQAPGSADRDRAEAGGALIDKVLRVSFGDLMHRLMPGRCRSGAVHRRVGIVLNEHLTTLLANPDTLIRIHAADPATGTLTRHDPTTYRPGAALARAVRARDGTCRMPGCATPAERCQLDHVTPFPHGPTQIGNLASLCTAHHGFKHHAGWHLSMTPDGICTWTSPLHRSYTTHPQDHRDLAA